MKAHSEKAKVSAKWKQTQKMILELLWQLREMETEGIWNQEERRGGKISKKNVEKESPRKDSKEDIPHVMGSRTLKNMPATHTSVVWDSLKLSAPVVRWPHITTSSRWRVRESKERIHLRVSETGWNIEMNCMWQTGSRLAEAPGDWEWGTEHDTKGEQSSEVWPRYPNTLPCIPILVAPRNIHKIIPGSP